MSLVIVLLCPGVDIFRADIQTSAARSGTQNPQWWSKQATPLNYPGTGAVTKVEG